MSESRIQTFSREKIAAFFERLRTAPEDRIVVAFSGGPDSTFLLSAMSDIFGSDRLVAAHFNHALRGEESVGDESFCKAFAASFAGTFRTEKADTAGYAKERKIGIEEAARELRYGFLERVREETGCRFVATGHTADDLAETLLFRFVKGTKIRGLKGIPEISGTVVRPLLRISKADVLSELRAAGTAFRTDSSNADVSFERNRLRVSVFPELSKINPSVRSTLTNFAAYAGELDRFLDRAVSEFLGPGDSFARETFAALDPFFAKEVLGRLYVRFNETGIGLSDGMVEEMFRFSMEMPGGKEKAFGKLLLRRSKGRVAFGPISSDPRSCSRSAAE